MLSLSNKDIKNGENFDRRLSITGSAIFFFFFSLSISPLVRKFRKDKELTTHSRKTSGNVKIPIHLKTNEKWPFAPS